MLERVRHGLQVSLRQMKIPGRSLEIHMAEQHLDRAQVCSGLEQVRRPAVAQDVRRYVLLDTRIARGLCTDVPDDLVRHGSLRTTMACTAGEKVGTRLLPAPVLPQRLQ